jgi:enterochelin esterase family protein
VQNLSIIERARLYGNPVIDGEVATFVWLGDRAPHLIGDFTGWEEGDPAILAKIGNGIWSYQLALPSDTYMEYVFVEAGSRVADPLNNKLTSNGMGKYNHYFYMPGAHPTPLTRAKRGQAKGKVTHALLTSKSMLAGGKRTVHFYQPITPDPVPLVLVWDGSDYLRRARLTRVVDRMIAEKRISPIALALIDNGGPARNLEYGCNEVTLGMILVELLPLAQQYLNLIDYHTAPGSYGVIGASMGGLMALYTGLRMPGIFGHVLSQSGAFSFGEYDTVVFDLLRKGEKLPLDIWMDVGLYDIPNILAANRRMHHLLVQKGYRVDYREYSGGHNYPAWRDDIWRGLEFLFA